MMKNEQLLHYIQSAIELEKDFAIQEKALEECYAVIEARKPKLKLEHVPENRHTEIDTGRSPAGYVLIGAGCFFFFIVAAITGFGEFWWAPVIFGAAFFVPGILVLRSAAKEQTEAIQKQKDYESRKQVVIEKNKILRSNYDDIIRQCNESYSNIYYTMKPQIDETRRMLDRLYELNYVYPKYCTLPALTSIYEYFMTGRCTELTGPNGAYNLYEDEVRKDTVISQLNTVIQNLEAIKNNQYMLYQQVKSIQENTGAIVSELHQIKGYTVKIAELTALNAYYAARTERNTRITMYYHL